MMMKQLRVLLADDDDDDRGFFRDIVETAGINVQLSEVNNGAELMKELNRENSLLPDLLFLDLHLPLKNGVECLAEIKASLVQFTLPVIIISSTIMPSMIDQLYEGGAQYCCDKPSGYDAFITLFTRILRLPYEQQRVQPNRENFIFS